MLVILLMITATIIVVLVIVMTAVKAVYRIGMVEYLITQVK